MQHRSVSSALSLTMHVGATPSGLEPSGKNFHMASGESGPMQVPCRRMRDGESREPICLSKKAPRGVDRTPPPRPLNDWRYFVNSGSQDLFCITQHGAHSMHTSGVKRLWRRWKLTVRDLTKGRAGSRGGAFRKKKGIIPPEFQRDYFRYLLKT